MPALPKRKKPKLEERTYNFNIVILNEPLSVSAHRELYRLLNSEPMSKLVKDAVEVTLGPHTQNDRGVQPCIDDGPKEEGNDLGSDQSKH